MTRRDPTAQEMNIYFITYKFRHHYSISGYNRLSEFLPCRQITISPRIGRALEKFYTLKMREELKNKTGLPGYFPECLYLEWHTNLLSFLPGRRLFHFVYPENSFYFTGKRKHSSKTRLIATYHQPLEESRQFILKKEAIKRLDAVILLSESQREFFEPVVGNDKIHVIPHGIDLKFFSPAFQPPARKKIIAVGNWLRDFPTLASALAIVQERAPDIHCDVVSLEQNRQFFSGLKNVTFHSGISDEQLLKMYHESSAAVLSLTGAAANNALLEAMACGLPIVATDLPAIREYSIANECRYVPSKNPHGLAGEVIALLSDESLMRKMGKANAAHVQRFDWKAVAEQTMNVYKQLI